LLPCGGGLTGRGFNPLKNLEGDEVHGLSQTI
jgi:hypothetical protein